jgi:hypothetical protein
LEEYLLTMFSDMRRATVSDFHTTDFNLREKMKPLHGPMKAAARPGEGFRQGQAAPATATNAMFLTLGATLPGSPKTIAARVDRYRKAHFEPEGATCPVTKAATLGDALIALFEDATARSKLVGMEIAYDYEIVSFSWNDGSGVSVFHPHSDREFQERVKDAKDDPSGFTHLGRLGAGTFNKIAALVEKHQ